ncbi:DUF4446 family protein [Paenibacillus xerothermodurans]|uniref:DUF4446 family protein n=1 Tax=Paenibacillus xerothermodurans TaxID=1977292 RepID=A0A2W1N2Z9_PAEXE|nr:DUF4446 family protein [Paenibacillus xerothermodurans]PZE19079.1 DUF4446 family protein [Paenibacillus xerothermodurans]
MEGILELLDIRLLLLGTTAIMVIVLVVLFIVWGKLNKLRRQYTVMMNGNGNMNIEDALIEIQERTASLDEKTNQALVQVRAFAERLQHMKSHVGIHRYNAFAGSGSDLSFSLAFIDDNRDGIVITGIHNRDETYVYAKPLLRGESTYTLSPEEKEAINQCLQKK